MTDNKEKNKKESEFFEHVITVRRVTKVTKGGKRFSFSAFVVTGNKQGKIGISLGKSKEVALAITKATQRARKNLIVVPMRGATVPYEVIGRHGASKVIIRPASKGTGKIAGGAVRAILDAVGIEDVLTKSVGSSNAQNVAKATLNALAQLRSVQHLARLRGKSIQEMVKG